jgi:hypothetical protein
MEKINWLGLEPTNIIAKLTQISRDCFVPTIFFYESLFESNTFPRHPVRTQKIMVMGPVGLETTMTVLAMTSSKLPGRHRK